MRPEMTPEGVPTKEKLIKELTAFCKEGYLISRAKPSLQELGGLIGLTIAGGPSRPDSVIDWRDRREVLRSVLKEIAEDEVKAVLGAEYAKATIKLFRLDQTRPVERHEQKNLNDLQDGLIDGVRRKAFVEEHRPLILGAVADALIQREEAAMPPGVLEEPEVGEEPAPDPQEDFEIAPMADPEEDGGSEHDQESEFPQDPEPQELPDSETPPAEDTIPKPPRQEPPDQPETPPAVVAPTMPVASQSRRLSGTARALIGIVALIGVAAVVLLIVRSQSSESGQGGQEAVRQTTSPSPAATPPSKDPSNAPAIPPIDFTAEVVNWCYCGDLDTLESQIKIKPRFVNHSARSVDLRTGGSARLGLAIYARATSDRSWITPTAPRYRRYGRWLVVPPNAPGDLVSTTMFETHWERDSPFLRAFGKYLDPDHYEGDLVFNVPPDLSVGSYQVRLAYRLHSGDLYFPRKGAARQWHGYRKSGATF